MCASRSAWEHGGKPWKVQREGNNDVNENTVFVACSLSGNILFCALDG